MRHDLRPGDRIVTNTWDGIQVQTVLFRMLEGVITIITFSTDPLIKGQIENYYKYTHSFGYDTQIVRENEASKGYDLDVTIEKYKSGDL
ncbi:hypothetical protein fHeYen901_97 [Yersinia phage fHe-Yen9-01]|uniref:Uncharacterized protein n=1 Tax=Yersinia phage fHe-Yen9-01 TaxID=1965363 RepID=A0A1V0DXJ3_9CAUD|nr:hypothetical protein KNT60_gp096 [Yersinia phage fHe-Yen9-01]ARB05870.1 hypothetical protein fHeYen901_97 [Yersinia phage fHe-Yen9-01]